MRKIILALVLTLILSACTNVEIEPTGNAVLGIEKATEQKGSITESSVLEDFIGKPSIIIFASTTCPHCQNAIPVFQEEVYNKHNNEINMWVNVVNGKTFNTMIPQGLNRNLRFNNIAKTNCGYVPSWILLDAEGNAVLSSCGSEKSLDDIKKGLDELLV